MQGQIQYEAPLSPRMQPRSAFTGLWLTAQIAVHLYGYDSDEHRPFAMRGLPSVSAGRQGCLGGVLPR